MRIEHDGRARLQREIRGEAERIGVKAGAAADDHVTRSKSDERSAITALAAEHVSLQVDGPLRQTRAARGVQPERGIVGARRRSFEVVQRCVH
jgi:hypothetical protein